MSFKASILLIVLAISLVCYACPSGIFRTVQCNKIAGNCCCEKFPDKQGNIDIKCMPRAACERGIVAYGRCLRTTLNGCIVGTGKNSSCIMGTCCCSTLLNTTMPQVKVGCAQPSDCLSGRGACGF